MPLVVTEEMLDKEGRKVLKHMIDVWIWNFRTGTYKELCRDVLKNGSDGIACRFVLGRVEKFCDAHGLPKINVLCCNSKTHRPGRWAYDSAKEYSWRRKMKEIFAYNWKRIQVEL